MASPVIDRSGENAMNTEQPRIEYVEARRALLDALTALQPHVDAFVLIGAQAVYLRTAGRLPGYQPFTTDADLALDPSRLADLPLLADAMQAEGFEYSGEPGIWNRHMLRPGFSEDIIVPVDLIVPAHVAASAGRRGARLPGDHGRTAARKSAGVEGALVDHDPIEIASLETSDSRRMIVNVAGPAALLVAKVHKLGERLATPHRLIDKDAGDVFRLLEATPLREMIRLMQTLLADDRSAAAATVAIGYVRQLFATPRSPGVQLAVQALAIAADQATVTITMTGYTQDLLAELQT
jgi:hypothetical protein